MTQDDDRIATACKMWNGTDADTQQRAKACLAWLWKYVWQKEGDFEGFMRDFGEFPYKRWRDTHEQPLMIDDDLLDIAIAEQKQRNIAKYGHEQQQFD